MEKVEYASVQRRLLAVAFDLLIMLVILSPVMNLVTSFFYSSLDFSGIESLDLKTSDTNAVFNKLYDIGFFQQFFKIQFVCFALVVLYMSVTTFKLQQTPGKWITAIKVQRTDGKPLSLIHSIMRTISYIPTMLPIGMGFIVSLFSPKNQALHDYICKTEVIICERDFSWFEKLRKRFTNK